MSRRRESLCPTPSKLLYYSLDDAVNDAIRLQKRNRLARLPAHALYAYKCMCGRWHLSTKRGVGATLAAEA